MTKVWCEVHYNSQGPIGTSWGAGSVRMNLDEVGQWLLEQQRPVLVTAIDPLKTTDPRGVHLNWSGADGWNEMRARLKAVFPTEVMYANFAYINRPLEDVRSALDDEAINYRIGSDNIVRIS